MGHKGCRLGLHKCYGYRENVETPGKEKEHLKVCQTELPQMLNEFGQGVVSHLLHKLGIP